MGLMLPENIQQLREGLQLTQREISDLLQLGGKTWSRWETGRERPSRSMNILLSALRDRKLDVRYLKSLLQAPRCLEIGNITFADPVQKPAWSKEHENAPTDAANEEFSLAA
jgi:transcriptional regulator with XRE-family HTH domain